MIVAMCQSQQADYPPIHRRNTMTTAPNWSPTPRQVASGSFGLDTGSSTKSLHDDETGCSVITRFACRSSIWSRIIQLVVLFSTGVLLPFITTVAYTFTSEQVETGQAPVEQLIQHSHDEFQPDSPHLFSKNRERKNIIPTFQLADVMLSRENSKGFCRVAVETNADSRQYRMVESIISRYPLPWRILDCDSSDMIVFDIVIGLHQAELERSWNLYAEQENLRGRDVMRTDGGIIRFGGLVNYANYTQSYAAFIGLNCDWASSSFLGHSNGRRQTVVTCTRL